MKYTTKLMLMVLFTVGVLDLAAPTSAAALEPRGQYSPQTYAAAVLSNVVYIPVKLAFAGTGAAASGLTYVLSLGNERLTRSIWDPSVKGTYVVTPDMIDGRQSVHFAGPH